MSDLEELLMIEAPNLRPAEDAMAPERLGAARLTRYSFSRSVLRRAWSAGWLAERVHTEIDGAGRGEVAFRVVAEGHEFHFVAFLDVLDESELTDRVIGERWEIAAALIEGELDRDAFSRLRREVPLQERGRFSPEVLVLTRGNRSVRFFEYLIDELAAGRQPDPLTVGDAGYLMRSTAFYANGKYGMRSFEGYPSRHPLAAPYRAQFLAAWCFRELSYVVMEETARLRGGSSAVAFDDEWSRFFGLGNATGLGLVPYAFKHPRIINAWVSVRELALARVRRLERTDALVGRFRWWLDRAANHYRSGSSEPADPFLSPSELVEVVQAASDAFDLVSERNQPFDELMAWAMGQDPETSELVLSLLLELDDWDDDTVDELLSVDESSSPDLTMPVGAARELIDDRYEWLSSLDLDSSASRRHWWVYSDNTEEPRRVDRARLAVPECDMGIDLAQRIIELRKELATWPADARLGEVVAHDAEHLGAVARLVTSDQPYGEPRDNPYSDQYLPLQLQRFQLAQYGMDNFKPKSTDWLRVTLFQGAPRFADLAGPFDDAWVLPPLPGGPS